MADERERVKFGPRYLRVLVAPAKTAPLLTANSRNARRGFLASWYRMGFVVASNLSVSDAVEFSRWTLNEFGDRINYREETSDKDFFRRLHELHENFLNKGLPDSDSGDLDDEAEEDDD
jgi:hypothetical protein